MSSRFQSLQTGVRQKSYSWTHYMRIWNIMRVTLTNYINTRPLLFSALWKDIDTNFVSMSFQSDCIIKH